ncbi:MAG: hypothetical protein KDD01_04510 [Phaeodactylibacter sp.]|nr:hypothetical protein [Phaeodactylibacter sp.]
MKNLRFWAKTHPRESWVILTVLHFVLAYLWAEIGIYLYVFGWKLGWGLFLAGGILVFLGLVLYPGRWERKRHSRQNFVRRRSVFDGLLLFSGFLLTVTTFNQSAQRAEVISTADAAAVPTVFKDNSDASKGMFHWLKAGKEKSEQKQWRKSIRKRVKEKIKELRSQGGKGRGAKVMLLVLLSVGLSLGVLLLSCSLACSGAEGAAILLAILGVAGIVWLLSALVGKIYPEQSPVQRLGSALLIFLGTILLGIGFISAING